MRKFYKIIALILVMVAAVFSFGFYNNIEMQKQAESDRKMRALSSFGNYKENLEIRENYLNFLLFQEKLKLAREKGMLT